MVSQNSSLQASRKSFVDEQQKENQRNNREKISPSKQVASHKKGFSQSQDKENTNQSQENMQITDIYMQKSSSSNFKDKEGEEVLDYQEMEYENNMSNMNSINQGQFKKKSQKYSASKDAKIIQTMKAYFPGLNNIKEKKKKMFPSSGVPPRNQEALQNRAETQSSQQSLPSKQPSHNDRIIFVDDTRKQKKEQQRQVRHQSIERRSSNTLQQKQNNNTGSVNLANQASFRKNITQLPPIDKKQNVNVLDQDSPKNKKQLFSPQSNIEPPIVSESYQQFPPSLPKNNDKHLNGLQTWSDQKSKSFKQDHEQYILLPDNLEENEQRKAQQKRDYDRKNQEHIQKMQEKKMQEQKMIEETRQKMIKKQEKLKNMILKQAAENREKKEKERQEMLEQQQNQPQKKTPVKRKAESQPPLGQEEEKDKEKYDMMKKYYRNRYTSFLRTLQEQKKKKEQEQEEIKNKEEKKKAKLKDQIGLNNVQSRFKEDMARLNQQVQQAKEKIQVETQATHSEKKQRRGNSTVVFKGFQSSTSFNSGTKLDQASELIKAYKQPTGPKREKSRSRSRSVKRTLTPKIKNTKKMIVLDAEPVNEKDEEELQKELKAKKEAAERIRQRQQKYIQEMQEKKEKDQLRVEEERKRKEKLKQMAREQAKQNFEQFQNRPGLKEQQELSEKMKDEDDDEYEEGQKKKKKKQPKLESGIEAFIERNNPKRTGFLNITDMATWKRKYKVEDNTKVFICTGGYPDIKKALKKRGWVHNKDPNSPCFDLKWVLKAKDIDHNTLNDQQLVNHFNKAAAITTKVGLCHNLKNLIWFNNVDIDTFYPRCFDLAIQDELEDFTQEFKAVKAESYIKTYIRELRGTQGEKTTVPANVLKVALKVCDKRLKDLDDIIDDPNQFAQLVTDEEWRVLGADELNTVTLAQKKHEEWLARYEIQQNKKAKEAQKAKKKKKKQRKQSQKVNEEEEKKDEEIIAEDNDDEDEEEEEDEQQSLDNLIAQKYPEFKRAVKIIDDLKKKYPQTNLNGENNIWIIKPAGSSRGRGIALYKQLVEILDVCKQKESQFIAQKYIENQLLMKNRKFDIRQWVLVTDWNPLTIWLYAEPYIRFPGSDYNPDDLLDKLIHLSNNSVGKNQQTNCTYDIPGNMWCHEEFQTHLFEEYGYDVWEDKIKDQVKNIIINSLESVQDMFEYKAGCFELFGYDLMVDDEFNTWLIEVNSSPAMDYSTHVTTRLVKMVLEDCVKVVVDYASAKKKKSVDTGLFQCIYKAKRIVDKPMQSFGLNLVCEGKKIPNNKLNHY